LGIGIRFSLKQANPSLLTPHLDNLQPEPVTFHLPYNL
jgi:hypothetical protein